MSDLLSFNGSKEYRDKLITRNLSPYYVEGSYTPPTAPLNYEIVQQDTSPINTEDISFELLTEPENATIINKYQPENFFDGAEFLSVVTPPGVSEKILKDISTGPNGEYLDFVAPEYSVYEILTNTSQDLSNDTYIQRLAAQRLKEIFEERIAAQIERYTLGRVNLTAFQDPFNTSLVLNGQQPVIYDDFTITVPDGPIDITLFFLQRLTGTYIPVSPIEGDYFTPVEKQKTAAGQLIANTGLGKLIGRVSNKISNLTNSSEKFLQNTGSGQKKAMFNAIGYNRFKPPYVDAVPGGQAVANLFNKNQSFTNFYVGSEQQELNEINSPAKLIPTDAYGNPMNVIVYGPNKVADLYEENDTFIFGNNSIDYAIRPGLDGGFVWISENTKAEAGAKVGQGGEKFGTDDNFNQISPYYEQVVSTNYDLRKGSILDETQRIIDSAPKKGKERLEHVGNAINQVSKVFFDGRKEITKGSKVKKYITKDGKEVGQEYGRVFTKDTPYFTYSNLQSTVANTSGLETSGNIRRSSYSVLDSTYNLNITPYKTSSTNLNNPVGGPANVKKYMLSIENLAWKGSSEYLDLPDIEKGPNGGRIMWFPPYELEFDDTSQASFEETNFLGRPEPIYTYKNTSRSGNLSFTIIVDHPSVLNLIVNKALQGESSRITDEVVDSFFSGLKKYDIYELARKFNTVSRTNLESLYNEVLSNANSSAEAKRQAAVALGSTQTTPNAELPSVGVDYTDYGFYFDTTSSSSYQDDYNAYTNNLPNILIQAGSFSSATDNFFSSVVVPNFTKADEIRSKVKSLLENDNMNVIIRLSGTLTIGESQTSSSNLANSRLESVKGFFSAAGLDKFFENEKLQIVGGDGFGSSNDAVARGATSDTINCGEDLQGQEKTYSYKAMACRSVRFESILVNAPSANSNVQGDNQNASNNPNATSLLGRKPKGNTGAIPNAQGLSKKIIRQLLVESDYFEILKKENPFFYDSIKSKIKFFHPAFHSMTPEGLNSRITFLNQCVRPGKTIPTKTSEGDLVSSGAINTNFGRPPILILRIGDFYNCKIVPGTMKFSYTDAALDINPEGIGVQPMMVKVSLDFDMIGGHGLKGPVSELQNALSFNFYANTEMYDERATATEDTSTIDTALLAAIVNEEPVANLEDVSNILENDGGTTIGNITNNVPSGSTQSGTIEYKTFFGKIVDSTKSYFEKIVGVSESTITEFNYGIWKQTITEVNFRDGFIDNLALPSTNGAKIFGKPKNYEQNITNVKDALISDIGSNNEPLIKLLDEDSAITWGNRDIVKNNYEQYINGYFPSILTGIGTKVQDVGNFQADYYQNFRKFDLIGTLRDGKILTDGKPKIYKISGDTAQEETDLPIDYAKIATDLQSYYDLLVSNQIVLDGESPSDLFTAFTGLIDTDEKNRLYTILSPVILNVNKRNELKTALQANLLPVSSAETIQYIESYIDGLAEDFQSEKDSEVELITNFKTSSDYQTYLNYNPTVNGTSIKEKDRNFKFTTPEDDATAKTRLKEIYSSQNPNSDKTTYVGKKTFN